MTLLRKRDVVTELYAVDADTSSAPRGRPVEAARQGEIRLPIDTDGSIYSHDEGTALTPLPGIPELFVNTMMRLLNIRRFIP